MGLELLTILVRCGLATSKGEARKLIQGQGLTLNGVRWTDVTYKLARSDFATDHDACVLRKGKKDFHLIRLGTPL